MRQAAPRRRASLVVPAAPASKLEKGATLVADEVVLDLEDAVVPAAKDDARAAVAVALGAEWAAPAVAVRVNAIGSPWCHLDLAALAASARGAVTGSAQGRAARTISRSPTGYSRGPRPQPGARGRCGCSR